MVICYYISYQNELHISVNLDIVGLMGKWMRCALKLTKKSSHPQHQMAAIITKGGAVISQAANHRDWGKHAERRALRPHHNYTGSTVYIVRANGRTSRPCAGCMQVLISAGVSKVVFVNESSAVETMRLWP